MKQFLMRTATCAAALSMVVGAPAAAAVKSGGYSPWAALSAFATPASSQALCGVAASSAAAASATQGAAPGCVLPAVDAPPPAVPAEAAPLPPVAPAPVVGGSGLGVIPLLAGLAVLAGAVALALGNGDEGGDAIAISP